MTRRHRPRAANRSAGVSPVMGRAAPPLGSEPAARALPAPDAAPDIARPTAEKAPPRRSPVAVFQGVAGRSEVRFVLTFVAIAGVLFTVYSFPYPEGSRARSWSDAYLVAYAHLSGWVLARFDSAVSVSGQNIFGHYSLRIVRGCDAIEAQILLASAILASSAFSWRWRLLGAMLGMLLLTVANVARICCLYYVGEYVPGAFDFLHHELWPLLLIAFSGATFVVWSRSAERSAERSAGLRPEAVHAVS